MNDQILVTGATGKQGNAVIRHLLKYGQKIKAMTRDPFKADELEKLGVEAVIGDFLDRPSLDSAFKGIKRMFLVATPYNTGVDEEIAQGMAAVDAAKAAGVEYLVYSSVGSANRQTGIPHFDSKWKIEEHIRELGIDYFILRPVFFMDNFASAWMLPALKKGTLELPVKADRKLAMVAVDDIGRFIAQAFEHPERFLGREIEFAGEEITFPEALSKISKITGAPLVYKEVPKDASEKIFGYDAATMYEWFNAVGYNPNIPNIEKDFSFPMTRFADYLKTASWVSDLVPPVSVKQGRNR